MAAALPKTYEPPLSPESGDGDGLRAVSVAHRPDAEPKDVGPPDGLQEHERERRAGHNRWLGKDRTARVDWTGGSIGARKRKRKRAGRSRGRGCGHV